jgi:predicted permease
MLHRIRYWIRSVFRRSALERELQDEMQLHLDRRTESLMAEGLAPSDARLAAFREFGNPTAHKDAARDATNTAWVDSIRADVRFALRYFARKPLSAATIVLILAFGIGGSAFQLSALRALTSRPPEGIAADIPLVRLRGMARFKNARKWHDRALSYSEIQEISKSSNVFDGVTAWTANDVAGRTRDGKNEAALRAQFVTSDFFKVIGARITHGPGLPTVDEPAQPVVVVSSALWEDMFDRGDVGGQLLIVNGVAARIVGVAPRDFTGALSWDSRRIVWLPLSSRATVLGLSGSNPLASLDSGDYQAVARLRPGVTPKLATAAVRVVTARVAPPTLPGGIVSAGQLLFDSDAVPLRGDTSVESDLALLFAAWAVLATLIIAIVCTNVSGLVISASVSRRHEIAVRLSLGASRVRLIRQLLTESILLALGGAMLGFVVYLAILAAMSRIPEARYVRADLPTFVLTMLVAVGTGILFGLTPAFHATRVGVGEVLKSGASGATSRSRLHQAFVVAQIFFVQPLLVLIASMVVSLTTRDLVTLPNGMPDHLLQFSMDLGTVRGPKADETAARDRLVHRLAQIPGVVGVIADPQLVGRTTLSVRDEDRGSLARANDPVTIEMHVSTPGYFDFIGVPLLRGDDLPLGDTTATAIISSDLARELWGSSDPIGRRFKPISLTPTIRRELIVTGVYDSRHVESGTTSARIYRSVKEFGAFQYLIRTTVPAATLADTVRRIAREELPRAIIGAPITLAQIDAEKVGAARTGVIATTAASALVLLLASIGLYGIVALSVGQRRREIGVRMALGARAEQVVGLFYRSGLKLAALGLALGLPISLVATRLFPALAEQMGTHARAPNVWIIGPVVMIVVLIVASIATLIPATRAATVNPVAALRTD